MTRNDFIKAFIMIIAVAIASYMGAACAHHTECVKIAFFQ